MCAWWRTGTTGAVAVLVLALVPPAAAGYPACRDVTEPALLSPEPTAHRYFAVVERHVEEWREFNGYTGLQREKCITEWGHVLGRDTFVASVDADNLPDVSFPVCGAPAGTPPAKVLKYCLDHAPVPDPGDLPDVCGDGPSACVPVGLDPDPDAVVSFIDWLQFVLAHSLQAVLGALPDP